MATPDEDDDIPELVEAPVPSRSTTNPTPISHKPDDIPKVPITIVTGPLPNPFSHRSS
jgi:hypothetical protein